MTTATIDPQALKRHIRDIPDFPKPGILFRDITPLLQHAAAFRQVIDVMAARYRPQRVDAIVAIESRGLVFGSALAYALGAGLVLMRKAGKLPHKTVRASYTLEYGEGVLETHADSLTAGTRVVLIDDLLATGGTMGAAVQLVQHFKALILEVAFIIELTALNGRAALHGQPVFSLLQY